MVAHAATDADDIIIQISTPQSPTVHQLGEAEREGWVGGRKTEAGKKNVKLRTCRREMR